MLMLHACIVCRVETFHFFFNYGVFRENQSFFFKSRGGVWGGGCVCWDFNIAGLQIREVKKKQLRAFVP